MSPFCWHLQSLRRLEDGERPGAVLHGELGKVVLVNFEVLALETEEKGM